MNTKDFTKDFTSNKKYFTQKSPVPFHVTYVIECFIAIIIFYLGAWLWPLAFAIFTVASVIEVAVCQRYVSDKYYESFLPKEKELFISEFEALYRPIDPRMLHRNAVASAALAEKHGKPIYGGEYRYLDSDFERVGTESQIRQGLDSVVRSSVYCFTAIQLDPRRVCLMTKRISMTEELEAVDTAALPYKELSSVSLETVALPIQNRAAHCIEIVFVDKEGAERFRLPVHGDYQNEELVDKLNEMIQKNAET